MRNISIDKFYTTIDKQVDLTTSFTEKPIGDVIKMCRLKPYDLLFTTNRSNIVLHNKWIDEYGNSLFISDKKKISIQLNDLSIDKKKINLHGFLRKIINK